MAMRISSRARTALTVIGVLAVAGLGFSLGILVYTGGGSARFGEGATQMAQPESAEAPSSKSTNAYGEQLTLDSAAVSRPGADGDIAARDAMVIRTNGLEMRVDKIEPALDDIRKSAKKYGATITELSVTAGEDRGPVRPLAESDYLAPAHASMVIRVDAEKLESLEAELSKVGKVLTQSGTASDVTQEYVDLSARLANLKATEARLRGFIERATKVTDLLEIEKELTRVRGDIEAMQAQVDYLERQTARATLHVSLTEPGPLVQPGGDDWGFVDAIRRGIQGAAALVTGLLTLIIALAPIAIAGLLVWMVARAIRKRRATAPVEGPVASSNELERDPGEPTAP